MNCAYHTEVENVAFCIRCGRPLCTECVRNVRGSVYCEPCLAEIVQGKSAGFSAGKEEAGGANPGAAFALGLIPGVGAIYNGEFFKAAIHILIFGTLISIGDAVSGPAEGLFTLMTMGFYIYMPFEAYYTAKKRALRAQGIDLETPIDRLHQQFGTIENKEILGGGVLIGIGVLFLLDNFNVIPFERIGRLWPLILIACGVWLLKRSKEKAA
jgi:TM2 domain-containing membrane protein YozV